MKKVDITKGIVAAFSLVSAAYANPQPPTNVNAVAGNGSVTVSWNAPSDTGGSQITAYTVSYTDNGKGKRCSASADRTSCTITGLRNNYWYTFHVVAKSKQGSSAFSIDSNPVIPSNQNGNGRCGAADGVYAASTPNPNDLCLLGAGPDPTLGNDGLYHWVCAGFSQGKPAVCSSATQGNSKFVLGGVGPAGGTIFYVTQDGHHGFEAAPVALQTQHWGCISQYLGVTDTAIGKGASNTAAILSKCSEANTAAQMAHSYSLNGFSDWFLPSRDEMALLINLPSYTKDIKGAYWSSTETGPATVDIFERYADICPGVKAMCYQPWGDPISSGKGGVGNSTDILHTPEFIPVRQF